MNHAMLFAVISMHVMAGQIEESPASRIEFTVQTDIGFVQFQIVCRSYVKTFTAVESRVE